MNQDILNIYQSDGRDAAVDFLTSTKGFSVEAANTYVARLEEEGYDMPVSKTPSTDRFSGDLDEDDEALELLEDEDE